MGRALVNLRDRHAEQEQQTKARAEEVGRLKERYFAELQAHLTSRARQAVVERGEVKVPPELAPLAGQYAKAVRALVVSRELETTLADNCSMLQLHREMYMTMTTLRREADVLNEMRSKFPAAEVQRLHEDLDRSSEALRQAVQSLGQMQKTTTLDTQPQGASQLPVAVTLSITDLTDLQQRLSGPAVPLALQAAPAAAPIRQRSRVARPVTLMDKDDDEGDAT
jgi:hypothetical protein